MKKIFLTLITILVITLLTGCIAVGDNNINPLDPFSKQTKNPTPTPVPSFMPSPTVIINGSGIGMVNGSAGANTSPTPSPTPPSGVWTDYDAWVTWVADYYYHSERPEAMPHINPLSMEAWELWKREQAGLACVTPKPFDGTEYGVRIYVPTPIPCPTPTPVPTVDPWSRERHRIVDTVQLPPPDYESTEAGILAWDADHSRGLYPYYSPNDHAVIGLRFVNNYYPKEIKNPEVYLVFKKQVLGQYIDVQSARWIEEGVTIPGAQVDQYEGRLLSTLSGFTTTVYEFDVPDTFKQGPWTVDSTGNYILEISVYADNVRACWISKQVAIT